MADWGFVVGNSVADRYVKSLYKVSAAVGGERAVAEQLNIIRDCVFAIKNYQKFLKKVSLLVDEGVKFVNFLKENLVLSAEVTNLLELLLQHNRLGMIIDIANAYTAYLDRLDGKKFFYVTFAKDVAKSVVDQARENLEKVFGGKVVCIVKKDESLIDGVKVQYRSRILDYSLKSKLRRLRSAMRGESYED